MRMDSGNRSKWLEETMDETVRNCRILYGGHCHCWECGAGWHQVLQDLSYSLETLNFQYEKYGVAVQAAQVKEKFAGLRFYYDVVTLRPWYATCWSAPFRALSRALCRIDYDRKDVVTRPRGMEIDVREVPEERLAAVEADPSRLATNVRTSRAFGKCWETTAQTRWAETRIVPTRHRALYSALKAANTLAVKFDCDWEFGSRLRRKEIVGTALQKQVDVLIRDAERQCHETCENCGNQIGTDWSPRCETRGWIRGLCKKCAVAQKSQYVIGNEVWQAGEKIKDLPEEEDGGNGV